MGLFKRKKEEDKNPYLGLRQEILNMKPSDDLRKVMNDHLVYAAIIDIDRGNAIATLACVADGTTSLYYSTGGVQMGIGHGDKEVRSATIAFLHSSEQVLDKLAETREFPLPKDQKHIVYLITENKIYKQEFDMDKMDNISKELKFLNFLYQVVLMKIVKYNKFVP